MRAMSLVGEPGFSKLKAVLEADKIEKRCDYYGAGRK